MARLKQLKPGEIRGEPGHALMACEGRGLSSRFPRRPEPERKTDGSHFWNVLLYSCLLKCKVNLLQKQDIVAHNHQTLSAYHIMANLRLGRIDRRRCNALLIKAVIAPVMQSGFEDEGCAGWDESDPRGPAAQSGLVSRLPLPLFFSSLSQGHAGRIGNCLLSAERARKFINT